jgi:uncharacterized NAD(P)/FAD-binding protein YdhS
MLSERQGTARRPASARRPTVAIVGAGASGMLVAAHLLRAASRHDRPLRAVLIERREQAGGVAYSTNDADHRLNVTAARMSALPEHPEHFVRWRAGTAGIDDPGDYAPRGEYRRYLEDLLSEGQREAGTHATLVRLVAEVDAVEPLAAGVRVRFSVGGTLDADTAVLALGNPAPLTPAGCEAVAEHPSYVNDPWAAGALDAVAPPAGSTVMLIGTGLTMVDVALTITRRFPQAQVLAVSRSGLLPRAHLAARVTPLPATATLDAAASLPELVDAIIARSAAGDPCWHQLVDDVRPRTQALWRQMSIDERVAFMATRHRAWCVRRHRMPPEVAARLAAAIGTGRLAVRSGSVGLARGATGAIEAHVPGDARPLKVAVAINCTGPGLDPRTSSDALVRRLLERGHARVHPVGIGFDTAPDGSLHSREGVSSKRLFTLGPPRVGELYETTAVPEIREQAHALAALVAGTLAADELLPAPEAAFVG